jgi:hypothetical protein
VQNPLENVSLVEALTQSGIGSHFQRNANREAVHHCTTTLPVIFGWTEQK